MQSKNDISTGIAKAGSDTSLTKLCVKEMGFSIASVSANKTEAIVESTLNIKQMVSQHEFKQRVCQSIYPYMPYDLDGYAIKAVNFVGFCEPKHIRVQHKCISFSDFNLILQVQYEENHLNIDDETMAEIRGGLLDLLHIDLVFDQMAFEVNYLYDVVIVDIENPPDNMTPILSTIH